MRSRVTRQSGPRARARPRRVRRCWPSARRSARASRHSRRPRCRRSSRRPARRGPAQPAPEPDGAALAARFDAACRAATARAREAVMEEQTLERLGVLCAELETLAANPEAPARPDLRADWKRLRDAWRETAAGGRRTRGGGRIGRSLDGRRGAAAPARGRRTRRARERRARRARRGDARGRSARAARARARRDPEDARPRPARRQECPRHPLDTSGWIRTGRHPHATGGSAGRGHAARP